MSGQRHSLAAAWRAGQRDSGQVGKTDGAETLGAARHELAMAREIRARELVAAAPPAAVAAAIRAECGPAFGTTWIRAYRLALGITLADVVAQVRAWYEAEARPQPRFSETLLSAYEGGQKRPGPEYLHYLCATYRADPQDLGYDGRCLCGRTHRPSRPGPSMPGTGQRDIPVSGSSTAGGIQTRGPVTRSAVTQSPAGRSPAAQGPAAQGPAARGPAAQGPVVSRLAQGLTAQHAAAEIPTAAAGHQPAGHQPAGQAAGHQAAGQQPAGHQAARHGCTRGADTAAAPARRILGGQHAAVTAQASDGAADDDELRRTLLRLITDGGAGVDGSFLGAVDRIRRRMDEALLGATVSATMIDQWEKTTAAYGRQYMTVPPLRLLCDALLDFGDVRRMCQERQPIEFEERLCRLAGRLASLAGMIMIDLGDQRLARSFFRTARTAADETGDRSLRAWVAAREALVPLYYGDPREAAALACTAADLAGRHTCVAGVMAPVIEARAMARLAGRSRREALMHARTHLDRAHDAVGDLPDEDRAGSAFGYTERQLLFHEGDTLVTLGDWQGAARAFSQASRLYSPAEFLDSALVALGQARCLLESDEPEQALRLSRDTLLGLAREHRSQIVVQGARALGTAVAARHADLPAVREYREALLTA
jgi:hypothetical protein